MPEYFKPEYNQTYFYWYMNTDGEMVLGMRRCVESIIDDNNIKNNNCFQTEAQAKKGKDRVRELLGEERS